MSKVYAISDLHIGHEKVANLRGFRTNDQHTNHMISQWNSIITKRDVVYILGDIALHKKYYPILNKLKGIKKVILGNHDDPKDVPELLKYVSSVAGMFKYKNNILTHAPIHPDEMNRHGYDRNVHGHTHDRSIDDHRYLNVCFEKSHGMPVELKEYNIFVE